MFMGWVLVFPAHAGMSPCPGAAGRSHHGFPRTRGDEPEANQAATLALMFSPHTRG